MKTIARIVGTVVIIVALVYLGLVYLNNHGFISGDFSDFLFKISGNLGAIRDDTEDFLRDQGYISTPPPTAEPSVTDNANNADSTDNADDSGDFD